MTRMKVLEIIFKALKAIKTNLSSPLSEHTILWNTNGELDSIQLVQFILELETLLNEEFGVKIILISDRALSRTKSPFLSVSSLAEFILELGKSE